jgi:predicted porin
MGLAGAGNNMAGSIYSAGNTGSSPNSASVRPVTVYLNQAVTYMSPKIAGFNVTAQYSQNAYEANSSTRLNGARESGGSITYTGIKNLEVGYGIAMQDVNVAGVAAAAASGTADTVLQVNAATTQTTQQALAANYDFGVLRAFANYTTIKTKTNGEVARDQSAFELGFRAPITKTINVFGSTFSGDKKTAANSATLTATTTGRADLSGYQLGTTYAFSKRTTAYAIYGTQEVKGKDAAAAAKIESTGYAVGLRHTF